SVGQVAPLGLALQTLGRWLHFAGYALAFGVLGVGLLLARAGIEPPLALGRLTNAGIVLLLVAEPVSLLGQTASLGPDQTFDGDALGDALASPFGRLLGFRLAAALLLWVIGGARFSSRAPTDEDEYADEARRLAVNRRLALGAAIALGVALAAIDALGQHAASFRPAGLGLAVHALHLMAMALWLASVAVLAAARGTPLPGISRIVAGALALVAVTGLGMALAHIPQPSGVVDTPYGVTLAAKQLPLLAALLLGWLAFRRRHLSLWLGELGALGVVIGVAGLLVSLPPPR
ncbi:MAG TPA: hypothetical protein VF157_09190, partial [Chloroflexota bacterium]